MSIPIDKLYHYIESIAREISGDDIVIYRFYPHGSKNIEDLKPLRSCFFGYKVVMAPIIYCYDQEPLAYDYYENCKNKLKEWWNNYDIQRFNLVRHDNIYDRSLLVHSEKRSKDVAQYQDNHFIPVYYWSHAIIARDWYRYAQYETFNKLATKKFLIYNRAWSGTREYRLKFIDLLIANELVNECCVSFNPIEPELQIHYTQHQYKNLNWLPGHHLEYYVPTKSSASSHASADYEIDDYNFTDFEVILETLFDDNRIQLTEKVLRPIALGQPFLLASTHGSLEYLRSYGFRTFASVIDESYDAIEDPVLRLEAIVKSMKEIASWTELERTEKMSIANQIAAYNRKHFFSNKFIDQVTDELKDNLTKGLAELEATNTSTRFISNRKKAALYTEPRKLIFRYGTRKELLLMLKKARSYYRRILPQG